MKLYSRDDFIPILAAVLIWSIVLFAWACAPPKVTLDSGAAQVYEVRAHALLDEASRIFSAAVNDTRAFTPEEVVRLKELKTELYGLLSEIKSSVKLEDSTVSYLSILQLLLGGLK